jgi:hypothetical protein
MSENIKGPVGTAFEGCEFIESRIDCTACECHAGNQFGPCDHNAECVKAVSNNNIAGHWIKSPPESQDVTPTVPGFYLVKIGSLIDCVRLSDENITMGRFVRPSGSGRSVEFFDYCKFRGPIMPPKEWEDGK